MREAAFMRKTRETTVQMSLQLDGSGESEVGTGIGFFDHMLELFAKHGKFDLQMQVDGDLYVDGHHTVEDAGIVLGKGIKDALGDKKGIRRYGSAVVPMDESLAEVAIDLSGRGYLVYNGQFGQFRQGEFDLELVEEFFRALALNGEMNLHINLRYGKNNHHKAEAIFKAFGRALKEAVLVEDEEGDIPSTKGVL